MKNKIKFPNEFICSSTIEFYIDKSNKEEIFKFLNEKGIEKLKNILRQINDKTATKSIYSSENYNNNIKNITAIKFKGTRFHNARIYCKDYDENKPRIIVLSELLKSKKQNKLTHKEKNLIIKVNNYEYQ